MRQVLRWSWAPVLATGLVVLAWTTPLWAGGGADIKAVDQAIHASLKDVINHGAALFNKFGDHYGCYRVFDGGLRAVRPLLAHHPDLQKAIDEGLESAEQMPASTQRAFALRRVIDHVRKKTSADKTIAVKDKKDKKAEEPKLPPGTAKVSGKVMFSTGAPAPSGYLTLIGADQAKFSAFIKPDGKFAFKTPIRHGDYVVTIEPLLKGDPLAAKNVPIPAYYRDALTSPLRVAVKRGQDELIFRLGEPGKK